MSNLQEFICICASVSLCVYFVVCGVYHCERIIVCVYLCHCVCILVCVSFVLACVYYTWLTILTTEPKNYDYSHNTQNSQIQEQTLANTHAQTLNHTLHKHIFFYIFCSKFFHVFPIYARQRACSRP